VIFAVYLLFPDDTNQSANDITVSLAEQSNIVALFQKTWKRSPTQAEFDGLIEARIQEELLYREAIAMELDKDDVIIRRRLAQKVDFIVDDMAAKRTPTDVELAAFLKQNEDRYVVEPVYSFRQVFLSPDRRGPNLVEDAQAMLAELKRGADPDVLGDVSMLPRDIERSTLTGVSSTFGEEFSKSLNDQPTGSWSGPVKSSYGAHLVYISTKEQQRTPSLEQARTRVERDWREEQRKLARKQYIKSLADKYIINVEKPAGDTK